jgi:hypothetical protein
LAVVVLAVHPGPAAGAVPAAGNAVIGPDQMQLDGTVRIDGAAQALVGQRLVLRLHFPAGQVSQPVRITWLRGGRPLAGLDRVVQPTTAGGGMVRTTLVVPANGLLHLTVGMQAGPVGEGTAITEVHAHRLGSPPDAVAAALVRVRLRTLGFLAPGTVSVGALRRAVLAFQKVAGLARSGLLDAHTESAVANRQQGFVVRFPADGRHIEADLSRQVLAEILPGGIVRRIYPISSGKPSTPTVRGRYRVYRREPGTNSHGMVDTSYFTGAYAIHGYASVPPFAASHGCLRVFVADAKPIYDWVRFGTAVDVYR